MHLEFWTLTFCSPLTFKLVNGSKVAKGALVEHYIVLFLGRQLSLVFMILEYNL